MKRRRLTSPACGVLALLLLALCLGVGAPATAQESIFALQFLGVSEETGDGRARGMGVLGIGLADTRTAITLNPAALGGLQYMTVSAMGIAGVRTSRSDVAEVDEGLTRFPHARFALPMFGKVVISAGFTGFRNFRGEFLAQEGQLEDIEYLQRFRREGTLYTIPLGLAGSFFRSRLRVGGTFDIFQGTVDEQWITEGDSLVSLSSRRRDKMTGRTVTLGVLGNPTPWLTLGISWSPGFTASRNRQLTLEDVRLSTGSATLRDESQRSDVEFPQVWRLGGSAAYRDEWRLSSDYLWREWSSYTGSLYEAVSIGNESRLGLGLEWQAKNSRLSYRLGGSRHTWAQRPGFSDLNETTLHLGLGVDISTTAGRLDFGLERAWIGDLAEHGLEESTWRFVVGVSGQETWKRRSPRRRE